MAIRMPNGSDLTSEQKQSLTLDPFDPNDFYSHAKALREDAYLLEEIWSRLPVAGE